MRSCVILVAISLLFFAFGPSEPTFHYLIKNEHLSLSVEKKLYRKPKSDTLYIRFILKNLSNRSIGFDLKQPSLISTHLCSFCKVPKRMKIREMRAKYWGDTLSEVDKTTLITQFKMGAFARIEPGQEFSYYKDFTLSRKYYKGKRGYLLVTCDGELIVVDAVAVKEYSLYDPNLNSELRDVVMKKPVMVETLAPSAYILNN